MNRYEANSITISDPVFSFSFSTAPESVPSALSPVTTVYLA